MNTKEFNMAQNKFQTKIELTLDQYYRDMHAKLISLIRELERILGKERAHQIVSGWSEQNAVNNIKEVIAAVEKPIETFEDAKILLRQWIDDLNENNIETVKITEETSRKSVCYVSECIYAKVLRDLNAADLGYILY